MSLRSSTGRSNDSFGCPGPAPRAGSGFRRSARPSGRARAPGRRRRLPLFARSTLTVILAAAFSAAASACAGGVPPSMMVSERSATVLALSVDEFGAASGVDAVGQPDDVGVAGRRQETLDGGQRLDAFDRVGFWRKLAERDAGGACGHQRDVARRLGQRHQRDARGDRRPALEISSSAALIRVSQLAAGGPAVVDQQQQRSALLRPAAVCGFQIGPAATKITSAAAARRSEGQPPRRVRRRFLLRSDLEQQPGRRRKSIRRGRGGITRSGHHGTGRLTSPSSSSGSANDNGNPPIMCRRPALDADTGLARGHRAMQEQQQFRRRAAGGVGGEHPAEPIGLGSYLVSMQDQARDDSRSPRFRHARR